MAASPGTLFLVGRAIGNLEDMTDRARRVLAAADLIAAEDTRRTGRLLAGFGIKGRLVSYFEGNERSRVPELLQALRDGSDVAVVSDGGMPGLSDPGYRLVSACAEEGVTVDVVPGPSAVVAALVVSGLPTDRFVFEGFLPRSGQARARCLQGLSRERRTIVIFESPRRVGRTLAELAEALGDRRAAVVRELTKLHQEVLREKLSELSAQLRDRELKGEVVLVIAGADDEERTIDVEEAARHAAELVAGGARKRDAAREAARATGVPASRIYAELVDRN